MIDQQILQNVVDQNRMEFELNALFSMYMDRNDIPDNILRRWKDKPRPALEVSEIVVRLAEDLFAQAVVEEEDA